jgi:hypothetical protein
MRFSETITMALSSLGVNKLRSGLTMFGITIGVFSVISVMTAIGALQYSIENGISFLGSNIFQFAKYPANVSAGGNVKKKYQNRRDISYLRNLPEMFWLRSKRPGGLQRSEDNTKSPHCRDESQFSNR